jgi:hypothetical protein
MRPPCGPRSCSSGTRRGTTSTPCSSRSSTTRTPAIQHAAVVALGRFGRAEAIEELLKPKIFRSPHHQIRWAAVAAVARLGDYRVIDILLKAAEDPEWIVRTEAVTGLMAKVKDIVASRTSGWPGS